MSKVVSLRLKDEQADRLKRAARRLGRTPSETAALLLEESLRQREFAFVEFRDSPIGRQAYIKGTRLAVWQAAALARSFAMDAARTAAHLEIPPAAVAAALEYAAAYPAEVDQVIADQARAVAELRRLVPYLEVIEVAPAAP